MAEAAQRVETTADPEPLALEQLYEEHAASLTSRLYRLCQDADLARDLTQDAFLIAMKHLSDFRGDAEIGTWLHGIAYNVLRDHRKTATRRRGLWTRFFSRRTEQHQLPPAEQKPAEKLKWLLAGLDTDQRDAFVLRVIEGVPLKDAAEILGAPVSTVSYRAKQAEAAVRKHFESDGGEP